MSLDTVALRNFDLVQYFMEFYGELTRVRRLAEQSARQAAGDVPDDPVPVPRRLLAGSTEPEHLLQRLQSVLEAQSLLVGRRGIDFAILQYREAQYVMAALADDVFLYDIDWPGHEVWRENILEYRIFGTRFAGERIFENIERILQSRNRREIELAPIYILALSLGFKGRLRGEAGRATLEAYSARLFELVFGRPADLQAPGRRLMADAYQHTLKGARTDRFRPVFRWSYVLGGIALAFLIISQVVWLAGSGSLAGAADAVIQAATPATR